MKKLYLFITSILAILTFAAPALAADQATFSAESAKTTYVVGDTISVDLKVDAGAFASTLSVVDMTVKISDPTVVEPANASAPFTLGSIFTSIVSQSYAAGTLKAAVFVDPNNKPTDRSGVIGTLVLKGLKAGSVTISYDGVQATQEKDELNFVTTSASSLTLNITSGVVAQTVSTAAASTSTKAAVKAATTVSTGPEEALLVALVGGMVFFLFYKLFKTKSSEGKL